MVSMPWPSHVVLDGCISITFDVMVNTDTFARLLLLIKGVPLDG